MSSNVRWLVIGVILGGILALGGVFLGPYWERDPYLLYLHGEVEKGMTKEEVVQRFGKPHEIITPDDPRYSQSRNYTEAYRYSPFGIHRQSIGHFTLFRLSVYFGDDGKVIDWSRSAPLESSRPD